MALQTEVHSSTPTSSSTGSAPDPTNTNSDSDSTEPSFSFSSSPPLILAFLGVGMLGIAMIVFFGWRRLTAGRARWIEPAEAALASFGEPPKLWDVWSPHEQQWTDTAEWQKIQPLAATVWDYTPLPVNNHGVPRHETLTAAAFAHLRRRYRNRRRSDESFVMDAKLARPSVRLQIAVTIAMPFPDFSSSSQTEPVRACNLYHPCCAKIGETRGWCQLELYRTDRFAGRRQIESDLPTSMSKGPSAARDIPSSTWSSIIASGVRAS